MEVTMLLVLYLLVAPCLGEGNNIPLGQCQFQLTCGQENTPNTHDRVSHGIGLPGKRGPPGPRGLPGTLGPIGLKGSAGPQGPAEPPGQMGLLGPVGSKGNEGMQGPIGPKGEQGLQGLVGPQGNPGNCTKVESELTSVKNQLNEITAHLWIKDCSKSNLIQEGVTTIYPFGNSTGVRALCDMTTSPGGWTVIQHRFDGSVDFYRTWDRYVGGFGEANMEYWIGLEIIHQMTKDGDQMLRVDLEDRNGNVGYATYSTFIVGSAETNFRLTVGGFQGNIGDSLLHNNNKMFSTKDVDNDNWSNNCATYRHGAWWYGSCTDSNLNGNYEVDNSRTGIIWAHWKGHNAMKKTKMMIRSKP